MDTLTRLKQGTTGDQVILHARANCMSYNEYKALWRERRKLVEVEEPVSSGKYCELARAITEAYDDIT